MKIKNKKNKTNYVNFKDNGNPKKIMIPAGKTVDVPGITRVSQIINFGDFGRGFFEIVPETAVKQAAEKVVEEKKTTKKTTKKSSKKKITKKKEEDSLEKVEKEVKDYTDNEK